MASTEEYGIKIQAWRCPECKGMCMDAKARELHERWHKAGKPNGNGKPANTPRSIDMVRAVGRFDYVTNAVLEQYDRETR